MAEEILVSTLVNELVLDTSPLEQGASRAEMKLSELSGSMNKLVQQYAQKGAAIEKLGAELDKLTEKYKNLSTAERFGATGSELQSQINTKTQQIDAMVQEYGELEDKIAKTRQQIVGVENDLARQEGAAATKQANEDLQAGYRKSAIEATALASTVRTLGSVLGVDSNIITAISSTIAVYKQALADATAKAKAKSAATQAGTVATAGNTAATVTHTVATNAQTAADKAGTVAAAAKQAVMTMGISIIVASASALIQYIGTQREEAQVISETEQAYKDAVKAAKEASVADKNRIVMLDQLIDEYDALQQKESLTAEEQERLRRIVGTLSETYDTLSWSIDASTGKCNVHIDALRTEREEMLNSIQAQFEYQQAYEAFAYTMQTLRDMGMNVTDMSGAKTAISEIEEWIKRSYGDGALADAFLEWSVLNKLKEAQGIWDSYLKNLPQSNGSSGSGGASEAEDMARQIDDTVDGLVQALKNRYALMEENEKQRIQDSIDGWKKWADTNVGNIQEQIDALDELTKKEENEAKAADLKRKADELRYRLAYETDEYNRKQLSAQLADAESAYQKELTHQQREAQKSELKAQQQDIKDHAAAQQETLKKQLDAVEKKYAEMTDAVRLQTEAQKMLVQKSGKEIETFIKGYNVSFFSDGQSFGEQMVAGLDSGMTSALDAKLSVLRNAAQRQMTGAIQAALTVTGGGNTTNNKNVSIGSIINNISGGNAGDMIGLILGAVVNMLN